MATLFSNAGSTANFPDDLHTVLTGEGWTRVENNYDDGTFYIWSWQNAAEEMNLTLFYYKSGQTHYHRYLVLSEDYNTTNHTIIRPAILSNTTNFACSVSDDSIGSTEYSMADIISNNFGYVLLVNTNTNWVGVNVVLQSYPDGLAVGMYRDAPNHEISFYAGKMESLVINDTVNDPITIGVVQKFFDSSSTGLPSSALRESGFTRSAMNAGKASHRWNHTLEPWHDSDIITKTVVTISDNWDLYQGKIGPTATQICLVRSQASAPGTFGSLRAIADKLIGTSTGTGNGYFGDTLNINTSEYILLETNTFGNSFPQLWAKKV